MVFSHDSGCVSKHSLEKSMDTKSLLVSWALTASKAALRSAKDTQNRAVKKALHCRKISLSGSLQPFRTGEITLCASDNLRSNRVPESLLIRA